MKKYIHAIILARGNSKEIKNKNLKIIHGKPLIYWSIKFFLKNKYVFKTWVSSDNSKILQLSKKYGANIILRPKKLATATATSDSAWIHSVKEIKKKFNIDIIIGVQPTSPIRDQKDINQAIKKFNKYKFDSMFSANLPNDSFYWKTNKNKTSPLYNYKRRPRRQDMDIKVTENGSFYIFKSNNFLKYKNRLFGKIGYHLIDKFKGIQIDSYEDFNFVKKIFK